MYYVHLKCGLPDNGRVVPRDEVQSIIKDSRDKDWYTSSYFYEKEALEYFQKNIVTSKDGREYNSIAGYKGKAFTDTLYWDIDCEDNFELAREYALKLIDEIVSVLGESVVESIQVYFSGNKGFHVQIPTDRLFNPTETKTLCVNLAKFIKVKIDPVVYNKTRAFRIVNTQHQVSGYFKIQLSLEELEKSSEKDIKLLAEKVQDTFKVVPISVDRLVAKYLTDEHKDEARILEFKESEVLTDVPPCPIDERSCAHNIRHGLFGAGERENALTRLAAYYYHGKHKEREEVHNIMIEALTKRAARFPEVNKWEDSDNERILDTITSESWAGGYYSCKDDELLAKYCDGVGLCDPNREDKDSKKKKGNVLSATALLESVDRDYRARVKSYPKFGMRWLDRELIMQPKTYGIIAGANGSGKTSFTIDRIEELNEQEIYHLIFSMDMSDNALLFKLAARYTSLNIKQIEEAFHGKTRDEAIVRQVRDQLAKHLPYTLFEFGTSHTVLDMTEIFLGAQESLNVKIEVVFIDYVGKILSKEQGAYAQATESALMMNDAVKRTNAHWILLAQVARNRADDHCHPILTSRVAKDSGAWEENATYVITIWRPLGDGSLGEDKYIHFYIAKSRTGMMKEMAFGWNGKTGDIHEMTNEEYIDYAALCLREGLREPPKNCFDQDYNLRLDDVISGLEEEGDQEVNRRERGNTNVGAERRRTGNRRNNRRAGNDD